MDPTTLAAFGDELEKISGIKRALRLGDSILRKGGDQAPKNLIEAGVRAGDKAQRALIKRKISPVGYAQKHQTDKQRHNLFKVMFSKTAQQTPAGPADKDRITKNKVKALLPWWLTPLDYLLTGVYLACFCGACVFVIYNVLSWL